MFGGNAKTHFQVLGKATTTEYMMSPFGDERWDLDDREKLKKIFKHPEALERPENNRSGDYFREGNTNYQRNSNVRNVRSPQQPLKQRHHGYIHQSETAQGYMPKSEITQNFTSPQPYNPLPNPTPPPVVQTQAWYERPRFDSSSEKFSSEPSIYKSNTAQEYYASPQNNYVACARRTGESNSYTSRSEPQIQEFCSCSPWSFNGNCISEQTQKSWSSPVWLPNTATPYRPFGPRDPTPSPYFPVPEKTVYMPFR